MKKILLILLLTTSLAYSQSLNFVLEDSISMSKKELSQLTELYIEEKCPQCKVISNIIDDENTIFLKCSTVQNIYCNLTDTRYTYSYNLAFKIRKNHYSAIIQDVVCVSVYGNKDCKCIQPSSEYTIFTMIDKESFDNLMIKLEKEMDRVLSEYKIYLKEKSKL